METTFALLIVALFVGLCIYGIYIRIRGIATFVGVAGSMVKIHSENKRFALAYPNIILTGLTRETVPLTDIASLAYIRLPLYRFGGATGPILPTFGKSHSAEHPVQYTMQELRTAFDAAGQTGLMFAELKALLDSNMGVIVDRVNMAARANDVKEVIALTMTITRKDGRQEKASLLEEQPGGADALIAELKAYGAPLIQEPMPTAPLPAAPQNNA